MRRDVMESRGRCYTLAPHLWEVTGPGPTVPIIWRVVNLDKCSRCDALGPVLVARASGTDLRAECCGLQIGVLS